MSSEQNLTALYQQLEIHRAALRDLWNQKASREQAITKIKASLLAEGFMYDTSPYDGSDEPAPEPAIPDEAREYIERALGGMRK